jgi:hypothetical protein
MAQHHLLVTFEQAKPCKRVGALGSALRVERYLGV